MKAVDVLYFVEHRDRELDAACLIAALLRQRFGRTVRVEPVGFRTYRSAVRCSPRVIVTPFCPSAATFPLSVFWPLYAETAVYVNLGFEQLLTSLFTHSHVPRDRFSREVVHHFAWNEQYKEWLNSTGVPGSHIPVTGSPQHAFYLPRYRTMAATRAELARGLDLDENARWVLFPLNYGGAFYDEKMIEGMRRKGLPEDQLQEYMRFCERSLDCVLDWVLEAARRRPAFLFIIRPRPVEKPSEYLLRLRRKGELPRNLRVVKSGPVRDWIINSDVVFSSFSTTLLDAALAQTPAYSLVPLPIPEWVQPSWRDQVPSVSERAGFYAAVDSEAESGTGADAGQVRNQFGLTNGDPLVRVAEALNHLIASASSVRGNVGFRNDSGLRFHAVREGIRTFAARSRLPWGPQFPSAHDYFSQQEVRSRISRARPLIVFAGARS